MHQAPPLREQARRLVIGPLNQRILDRIEGRAERERDRAERRSEDAWRLFEDQALRPIGDAPDRPRWAAPCTSVAETTRQWEDLQRFRLFSDLETDPLSRRFAVVHIESLLRQNVEQLRLVAQRGVGCPDPRPRVVSLLGTPIEIAPIPSPSDVVGAIVTEAVARAAIGAAVSATYVRVPGGTLGDAQARDLGAARLRASFGLEPIPNGVLLFRPEVERVLVHLGSQPTPR